MASYIQQNINNIIRTIAAASAVGKYSGKEAAMKQQLETKNKELTETNKELTKTNFQLESAYRADEQQSEYLQGLGIDQGALMEYMGKPKSTLTDIMTPKAFESVGKRYIQTLNRQQRQKILKGGRK